MTHVYLRHEDAAGSENGCELYPGRSYFLPNHTPNSESVDIVEDMDENHSITKLEIYEQDVLVGAYGPERTEILESPGNLGRFRVPISPITEQKQIIVVLRRGDQILTPSENSQPQNQEISITHGAVLSDMVSAENCSDDIQGTGSMMPPPRRQRADTSTLEIQMPPKHVQAKEPPKTDPNGEVALKYCQHDKITDPDELSQASRLMLEEVSANSVIILKTKQTGLSRPHLVHDEKTTRGITTYSTAANLDLEVRLDDIRARRKSPLLEEAKMEDRMISVGREQETQLNSNDIEDNSSQSKASSTNDVTITPFQEHNGGCFKPSSDTVTSSDADEHESVIASMIEFAQGSAEAAKWHNSESVEATENAASAIAEPADASDKPMFAQDEEPNKLAVITCSSKKRKAATYSKTSTKTKRQKMAINRRSPSPEDRILVEIAPNRQKPNDVKDPVGTSNLHYTARSPETSSKSSSAPSSTVSEKSTIRMEARKSTKPAIPSRSRSSSVVSAIESDEYRGPPPKVIFSSTTTVDTKKETMRDFLRLGCEETKNMEEANMLIIGDGPLKKTAKLIIAIARGMEIVNERWITASRRKHMLLDIIPYLPNEDKQQEEWGATLASAVNAGKEGIVRELLKDTVVYTTKDLAKDIRTADFSQVIKSLGGNLITGSLQSKKAKSRKLIVLGMPIDSQAAKVQKMGLKLFTRDLIVLGALRGQIDMDSSEFEIDIPVKEEESS